MRIELSIIIPAYNEEKRIAPTIVAIRDYLATLGLRFEILVVDDGSADGTAVLAQRMSSDIPELRCISYAPNRGKGHAVRVGMLAATGEVRLMCDADGSTPAAELGKLIRPVHAKEVEIAIGSRYTQGADVRKKQPFYRRWWSRMANQVVQAALVGGIRDTQCGYKALSARAAEAIFSKARIDGWAFDLEVLALARHLGLPVTEVAVAWADDPRSRISPVRDAIKVCRELLVIRKNLRRGVYGELAAAA